MLTVVAGAVLAVGVPVGWAWSQSDSTPTDVAPGMAAQLAGEPAAAGPTTDPFGTMVIPVSPELRASTTPAVRSGAPRSATTAPRIAAPTATKPAKTTPAKTEPEQTAPETTARVPKTTPRPAASAPPSTIGTSLAPVPVGTPVRIRIPELGVDAPVAQVGVDDHGDMAIPEQVDQVGWYRFGPAPGSRAGSVVLAGHVDSAQQGIGVFHELWNATAGDTVVIATDSGREFRYRVVSREAFDKKAVPMADLFSTTGAPRLTLITCGGSFDSSIRSYDDNIVVTAVPA